MASGTDGRRWHVNGIEGDLVYTVVKKTRDLCSHAVLALCCLTAQSDLTNSDTDIIGR